MSNYVPSGLRDLWIVATCEGKTTGEVCVELTSGELHMLLGMSEDAICVAMERLRASGMLRSGYDAGRGAFRWSVTEWGRQVLSMTGAQCLRALLREQGKQEEVAR